METIIAIICGIAVAIAAAIAERIYRYLTNVGPGEDERTQVIEKLSEEYIQSYTFSPADEKLKNDTVDCLKRICPNGLGEKLSQFDTHEARKEYAEKVVYQLAEAMGVELEGVCIEDEMPDYTLGLFHDQGYITINAVIMEADPERILMTIVHELRHGVQYQACIKDNDRWGFSTEVKGIWYFNWQNYIDEPFDLYQKQPLEYDANMFANAVIHSTY